MKKIIPLFLICFMLSACDFETSESGNQTDVKENPIENTQPNWLCIPNQQVGLINTDSDEAAIIKAYGAENVSRREVGIGDREMTMASVVFPNTANELIIEWEEDFAFKKISRIRIEQDSAEWKTKEGIRIGTSLDELIKLNEKDFNFYGFEWDESGAVNDWDGGKINPQLVVFLAAENPEPVYPDLLGDEQFSSAHPKAKAANLKVYSMVIHFGL